MSEFREKRLALMATGGVQEMVMGHYNISTRIEKVVAELTSYPVKPQISLWGVCHLNIALFCFDGPSYGVENHV